MDNTTGSDPYIGIAAYQGAGAAGWGHADRDEDYTGDTVSVPSDHTRWQRSGLHEGHCPVRTRDGRPLWCAARGDVAGSGTVHTLRPCSGALSSPGHPLWSPPAAVTFTANDTSGDHWGTFLQGNHWECTNCEAPSRYVHHGAGTGGQVVEFTPYYMFVWAWQYARCNQNRFA